MSLSRVFVNDSGGRLSRGHGLASAGRAIVHHQGDRFPPLDPPPTPSPVPSRRGQCGGRARPTRRRTPPSSTRTCRPRTRGSSPCPGTTELLLHPPRAALATHALVDRTHVAVQAGTTHTRFALASLRSAYNLPLDSTGEGRGVSHRFHRERSPRSRPPCTPCTRCPTGARSGPSGRGPSPWPPRSRATGTS
jgi:hypothetical protein